MQIKNEKEKENRKMVHTPFQGVNHKRVKYSKHADMLREYAKTATTLKLRQKIGHLWVQGQSSSVEKKQI
jgi:hypothetical protein